MKKRLVYGIAVVLLAVGAVLLLGAGSLISAQPSDDGYYTKVEPQRSGSGSADASASVSTAFSSFPVDAERTISFDLSVDGLATMTEPEKLDQVRDWLLYSIVSDSAQSPDQINRILFDLPPVRYGYLQPVANFQYGETRISYLGSGVALALIPYNAKKNYQDELALAADETHKNTGDFPTTLDVFDYTIDLRSNRALVTRRADVAGSTFTTPESGYVEMTLSSYADLQAFMSKTDRLISARLAGSGITVSGRKLQDGSYLNISAEDVAALWQSQSQIKPEAEAFNTTWYAKADALDHAAFDSNPNLHLYGLPGQSKLSDTTSSFYSGDSGFGSILTPGFNFNTNPYTSLFSNHFVTQQYYETVWLDFTDQYAKARSKGGIVDASGFSLDPTYRFPELFKAVNSISPLLKKYASAEEIAEIKQGLTDEDIQPLFDWIGSLKNAAPDCSSLVMSPLFDDSEAALALAQGDGVYVQTWLNGIGSADNCDQMALATAMYDTVDGYFSFQQARYDGKLAGTEDGMVLFYTDLLAKLWAMDFQYSSPGAAIPDFVSLPESHLAHVFDAEEQKLSNTRLWFGKQYNGFQSADNGDALLFGSVATRVYAASSNELAPGVESEPSARSAAFLGWWDNHYAEIAQFEPQYQRLNEIMKWSTVFAWLADKNYLNTARFLEPVEVNHSNWFPDWAKAHPELRFQDWSSIGFYDRGSRGLTVESLPLLITPPRTQDGLFWSGNRWEGGVSLPDPSLFDNLASLPSVSAEDSLGLVLRSDIDYGSISAVSGEPEAFSTIGGTHYEFATLPDAAVTVDSVPVTTAKLRSPYAETINAPVDRTLRADISGMQVNVSLADVPVGQLDIRPSSNGFAIGYQGFTMDQTNQLGQALSQSSSADWGNLLQNTPNVQDAVQKGNVLAVRFKGDPDRWVEFSPERASVDLPKDVDMRVSASTDGAKALDARVMTTEDVSGQFDAADTLKGSFGDASSSGGGSGGGSGDGGSTVPPFDDTLYPDMSSQNYDDLALLLLSKPDQASLLLAYKPKALKYIGELLANNRQVEALDMIGDLRRVYGDEGDLVALDALVKSDISRPSLAADAVNTARIPEGAPLTFDDELIARIHAANSAEDQFNVARILQATALQSGGHTALYVDGDVLNLELYVDTLPVGETVPLDAIPPGAPVYIADSFNLTNADPSLSVRQVLSQPDFGADARAFRMSGEDIGAIRPGRVVESSSGRSYRFVDFDEPTSNSAGSGKAGDFIEDLVGQILQDALDSSCSAGQTKQSDGSCSCPNGTVAVGNSCVKQVDVYVIVSGK